MRELHGHTSICSGFLSGDLRFGPRLLFKGDDLVGEFILLGIVGHVEQTEAHLSKTGGSRHVVPAFDNPFDQIVGNRLTRLVMEGEGAQELLLHGIVLHELRGQFHEVPPHIGTAKTLKARVGKHAVQGVSELMQERFYLTQCQQGGFLFRRLGEVHHHADMRTYVLSFAVNPLSLELRHPCTSLLTLSWVEVGIEHSQIRSVLVEHLVSLYVGMIYGNLLVFLKGDAIKTVSKSEDTINHLRQLKIRTKHLCIEVELLQLQTVRIEPLIPRLHLEVLPLTLLCHLLEFRIFLLGSRLICIDQIVKQSIYILHLACHTMFQHIVGIGAITQ